MCASPYRAEMWKLAWAVEATAGIDPATAAGAASGTYINTFGVVQNVTMPDPQMDIQPFWGLGTASTRNWFVAYHGKQTLNGSIGSFMLLDGKCLRLALGTVANTTASTYKIHTISEAVNLPSISLHNTIVDADGANSFMRRYHGGKINRMTLSAQEGSFLMCSIDDMQFMRYTHNISAATADANVYDSYNSTMQDIQPMKDIYTCDQPYLFAQGTLSLWGTTFARIRSFNLSIDNGCQAKYYIQAASHLPLPYEIREGKRTYNLNVTVDIEDTTLFRELLRMGYRNSIAVPATWDYKGFNVSISFSRGVGDSITLTSPANQIPLCGGDSMGCLIKSAPHNISTGELLVSVPLSITCRNLGVVVNDAYTTYV